MYEPITPLKKLCILLILTSFLILSLRVNAIEAKDNYWSVSDNETIPITHYYPSAAIYGFVGECWKTMEGTNHPMTVNLWPAEIQSLCGCILDNIRMSVPWTAFRDSWKGPLDSIQNSMVADYSTVCMKYILSMKSIQEPKED